MGRKSTVAERLSQLLETGKYSDQDFLLQNGETLKGHKIIFAVASPVFDVMLYGNLAEEDVIEIKDIDTDAFKTMAKFIYTDELDLDSANHAMAVYRAGDKYDIPDLQKETEEFINQSIKTDNVLDVLKFSILYKKTDIEDKCYEMLQSETSVVLNSKNLLDCDTDVLELIVNRDKLTISEIELFNYMDKWAKHKALTEGKPLSSIKTTMKNIIEKIRFLTMDVSEFSLCVYKSDLLSTEEKLSILVNLSFPNCAPLPDGFCNSVISRSNNSIVSSDFKFSSCFDRVLSVKCEEKQIFNLNPNEYYQFPVIYFYNTPFLISIHRGPAHSSEDNEDYETVDDETEDDETEDNGTEDNETKDNKIEDNETPNNNKTEFLWIFIHCCTEEIMEETDVLGDDVLRNVEITFKVWGRNDKSRIQSVHYNFSHSSMLVTPEFSVPIMEWDELIKDRSKEDDSVLIEIEMKAVREISQVDKWS